MSSYLWPGIQISKVDASWFRSLNPGREDVSLTKFEELLEHDRRRHVEKGLYLPFHGKTEVDNGDKDEEGDDGEEESEAGDQDDEMDAQPGPDSPATHATATTEHDP